MDNDPTACTTRKTYHTQTCTGKHTHTHTTYTNTFHHTHIYYTPPNTHTQYTHTLLFSLLRIPSLAIISNIGTSSFNVHNVHIPANQPDYGRYN